MVVVIEDEGFGVVRAKEWTPGHRNCQEDAHPISVTARPYAFAPKVLDRVELKCDAYLSGREENIGSRMVKMLEVRRANNADLSFGNLITFDIEAGVGIKMVPGTKVRI